MITTYGIKKVKSTWCKDIKNYHNKHGTCNLQPHLVTYPGVPMGANMRLKKIWKPIIDKFMVWKSKTLSFGGRLILITAVLGNLPTYFLYLFAAPIGVLDQLEKIRRDFLWDGFEENLKN